jgi:hypothetical protein
LDLELRFKDERGFIPPGNRDFPDRKIYLVHPPDKGHGTRRGAINFYAGNFFAPAIEPTERCPIDRMLPTEAGKTSHAACT